MNQKQIVELRERVDDARSVAVNGPEFSRHELNTISGIFREKARLYTVYARQHKSQDFQDEADRLVVIQGKADTMLAGMEER